MELLTQLSNTQFLFPVAAVAVVLICAALVFVFGFHSAEPPQFDKLPLVVDDRKSSNKKNKKKDKKSSPNRSSDDVKTKSESSKKSPSKEKKEEKPKEADKPKRQEKPAEPKVVKKEVAEPKKGKKAKATEVEKPADFDDAGWQEVPKKSEKKKEKVKTEEKEKKKASPAKKTKKTRDADVEAARPAEESSEETIKVISVQGPHVNAETARALQAQVEEMQRVLKEAERRDQIALGIIEDNGTPDAEELTDVKDLRSSKKNENKEKQNKKKANETVAVAKVPEPVEKEATASSDNQEDNLKAPVFDELGDTWTESKTAKKSKKKVRKDQ